MALFHIDAEFSAEPLERLPKPLLLRREGRRRGSGRR